MTRVDVVLHRACRQVTPCDLLRAPLPMCPCAHPYFCVPYLSDLLDAREGACERHDAAQVARVMHGAKPVSLRVVEREAPIPWAVDVGVPPRPERLRGPTLKRARLWEGDGEGELRLGCAGGRGGRARWILGCMLFGVCAIGMVWRESNFSTMYLSLPPCFHRQLNTQS